MSGNSLILVLRTKGYNVSVAAKSIKTARRHVLNIYTTNMAYEHTFGFT
ncbi:MAG: hypothetical protein ACI3YB_06330 [Prevotella sp.]